MRIHLSIERNGLPVVNLLWPVDEDENGKRVIISRLVAKVDEVVPLETEEWALEDYILQVDGFECLHWQNISDVLKDEDHVTIRPLETSEIQTRYLQGRSQIDRHLGVHLYDGVPFGRPCLRKPIRPRVKIPPRKRRRIDFEEDQSIQEGEDNEEDGLLQIEDVDENEGHLALFNGGFAELREQDNGPKPKKARLGKYTVRFEDTSAGLEDEDEDSEDDGEFNPDNFSIDENEGSESASSSEVDSDSTSDSDSSSSDSDSSSSDSDSVSGFTSTKTAKSKSSAKLLNGVSDTSKPTNGIKSTQRAPIIEAPPGQGKNSTRQRNLRRKEAAALSKLKKIGVLPGTANHEDLRRYREAKQASGQLQDQSADVSLTALDAIDADAEMANGGDAAGPASGLPDEIAAKMKESQDRLNTLLQQSTTLTSMIQANGDEEEAPEELSSKPAESEESLASAEPATKRARLDVRGAQRHIFGSLGVRAPKTAKDAEKTRAKLIEQIQPKKPAAAPGKESSNAIIDWDDEDPESEAWRSRINLSAVECVQEDVTGLSEPPYPFYQRWDPQQQLYKGKGGKKRKNKGRNSWGKDAFDQNAEYEYQDDTTWLDYDEADAGAEGSNEDGVMEEDLPQLPEDMSTLPSITPSDLKPGAIIAFKQLEMSQATNWEPKISGFLTALITEVPDDTATITDVNSSTNVIVSQLARRDRKQSTIRYDDQGNRIFEKFEMEGEDDDDVIDEGVRVLAIMEMRECKLVKGVKVEGEVDKEGGVNASGETGQEGEGVIGDASGEGGGEGGEWVGITD